LAVAAASEAKIHGGIPAVEHHEPGFSLQRYAIDQAAKDRDYPNDYPSDWPAHTYPERR